MSPELQEAAKAKLAQITNHFGKEQAELKESFRQLHEVQSSRPKDSLRSESAQQRSRAKATQEAAKLKAELDARTGRAQGIGGAAQKRASRKDGVAATGAEAARKEDERARQHEDSKSKLEASLAASGKEKKMR